MATDDEASTAIEETQGNARDILTSTEQVVKELKMQGKAEFRLSLQADELSTSTDQAASRQ